MAGRLAYEVLDDGRERARWLAARQVGVGASEIPTVLGVGYGSALTLYARKRGLLEEQAENPQMRFGKRYEGLLAQDLAELTGRRTTLDGRLLRSRRWPWLLCTLDALQWSAPRKLYGGAELKTTGQDWEARAQGPWHGWPQHVYAQVQAQYAVTDLPTITAAVFNRATCETLWGEIPRDPEYVEALVEAARDFMARVERGDPPPPDASAESTRALGAIYARAAAGSALALEGPWLEVADRWQELAGRRRELEQEQRALRNQVLAHLGEAEVGVLPDGSRFVAKTVEREAYTVRATRYRDVRFAERPGR